MNGPDLRDLSREELIRELVYTTRMRNAAERRERACDAKRRKLIEQVCPWFESSRDFGNCRADNGQRCNAQCGEKFNFINNDGRLVYGKS